MYDDFNSNSDNDSSSNNYKKTQKGSVKTIIIAVLIVLLAVNTLQLVQIKQELNHLRDDYVSMYNTISNRVRSAENAVYRQTNEIRDILNEQAALFETTSVDVAYQDRKLAVTVSAVPKALTNSETVWVSLAAGDNTYTQQFDANGKATILLEPTTASFIPTLQIKSPTGIKQQVLDEISTIEFMSANVEVFWNDALAEDFNLGHVLEFYLHPWKNTLPFTAEEIADIYLIVSTTGPRGDENAAPESVGVKSIDGVYGTVDTILPEGERVDVVMMEDSSNRKVLIYYADLTEFVDRADNIEYEVHLVVETVYGLTYSNAGYEPLASFCFDKGGGHQSASSPLLAPMFSTTE